MLFTRCPFRLFDLVYFQHILSQVWIGCIHVTQYIVKRATAKSQVWVMNNYRNMPDKMRRLILSYFVS